MSDELWQEFLDKCEFVYLTEHPMGLPWAWLEELEDFEPADPIERQLLTDLRQAEEQQWKPAYNLYLERRNEAGRMAASKIGLRLNPGDPLIFGGDALICAGSWDRMGAYLLKKAGVEAQPSNKPVGYDASGLSFRRLIVMPEDAKGGPRQLRKSLMEALTMAYFDGCRNMVVTHLPAAAGQFSDDFAAAEVLGGSRAFLMEQTLAQVRIVAFGRRLYPHYQRYMHSLGALRVVAEGGVGADTPEAPSDPAAPRRRPTIELEAISDSAQGLLAQGRQLVSRAAQTISGQFEELVSSAPATVSAVKMNYDLRHALACLELGHHEGALQALGRYSDSGQALVEYLKAVVIYDRYLRQAEEADAILVAAMARRGQQELPDEPRASLGFALLELAVSEVHDDQRLEELQAQAGKVGWESMQAALGELAGRWHQQDYPVLRFEGAATLDDSFTLPLL